MIVSNIYLETPVVLVKAKRRRALLLEGNNLGASAK